MGGTWGEDGFGSGAVLLEKGAIVRGCGGNKEWDLRQGYFLEALVDQGLRSAVAVAVERGGEEEDGAAAVALERLLTIHRDGEEVRVLEGGGKLGGEVGTLGEELCSGGERLRFSLGAGERAGLGGAHWFAVGVGGDGDRAGAFANELA